MRLYDFSDSGNGYKVRLLLSHLGRACEFVEVDILEGESRTPEFLAKNPNGKIPVLQTDDGRFLPESNAILYYLARGTKYLSDDLFLGAQTLRWMCFEQYSHEPNIATARFWLRHSELTDETQRALERKRAAGYDALSVMESQLRDRDFFVDTGYSIADIALYAYTHVAHEGGFELDRFPAVQRWCERISDQPGYVAMTRS